MVVKKIIQICKKSGFISLYDDGKRKSQWLGDVSSFYPLYRMPVFDEESLCAAYDITEKQAEKIRFSHTDMPRGINFSDVDEGEHIIEPIDMALIYGGTQVQPYMTSQGIKFMDRRYMGPIEDEGDTHREVYERFTESGVMYFAVKIGLRLVAVIFPIPVVSKHFVDLLGEVYVRSKVVLESEAKTDA